MTDKQIIVDEINKTIEQEMENLRNIAKQQIGKLEAKLKAKEQELKKICKAFDIEYAIDEETGNLIGRCNKLYKKEQECEELKKQVEVIKERLFRKIAPIDYTDCPYYIKMVKLKQTLVEIKEIVEEVYYDITTDYLTSGICSVILQKIREIEDEHNG